MTVTEARQGNLRVAREIVRLYRAGRVRALIDHFHELFTEDLVWRSAIVGGVEGSEWHGRDGFVAYERELFGSFEDVQIEVAHHEDVGDDTVVSLGHVRTVGRDSRVALSADFAFVWRFRNGRAHEGYSFLSHEEAREAARAA